MVSATGEAKSKWMPPYISFKTVMTLLEKMEQSPTPRIDRSYLDSFSGGYQAQVIAALRSLDLIDAQGNVRETFRDLVGKKDERKQIVGALVRQFYPRQLELAASGETQAQLEALFREYEVTGSTHRRAIAFFMQAAQFAGIPLSTNWKVPSMSGSTAKRGVRPKANVGSGKNGRSKGEGEVDESPPPPPPPPATTDTLKTRYIELLMKKVEGADGNLDEGLLDRIEGLLGFDRNGASYEDELE